MTIQNNHYKGLICGALSYSHLLEFSENNISNNGMTGFGFEKNFRPRVNTWSSEHSYIQTSTLTILPDKPIIKKIVKTLPTLLIRHLLN